MIVIATETYTQTNMVYVHVTNANARKRTKMKKLTKRQQTTLKKHSVHHSKKHMTMMRKEMRAGKSFTAAHKKAKRLVGK